MQISTVRSHFDALGPEVNFESLSYDLDFEERIDGLIDRYIRRLLYLRGLKSMSVEEVAQPVPLIARPPDAA